VLTLNDRGSVNVQSLTLLLLSCVWGTGISFLGFLCLENISATTFNVMGNANKMLTLVINSILWTHHASLSANICLAFSLTGAAFYGEAKRRQGKDDAEARRRQQEADAARGDRDGRDGVPLNDIEARGGGDSGSRQN